MGCHKPFQKVVNCDNTLIVTMRHNKAMEKKLS